MQFWCQSWLVDTALDNKNFYFLMFRIKIIWVTILMYIVQVTSTQVYYWRSTESQIKPLVDAIGTMCCLRFCLASRNFAFVWERFNLNTIYIRKELVWTIIWEALYIYVSGQPTFSPAKCMFSFIRRRSCVLHIFPGITRMQL